VCLLAAATVLAGGRPRLLIHVIDRTAVPYDYLIEAEHIVERVLGTAGVQASWRERKDPPVRKPGTAMATVIILSANMVRQKAAAEHISGRVLATAAPPPGDRAWIFFDRVRNEAEQRGVPVGVVLGRVISHEIGHMVAGMDHSAAGTMEPALRGRPSDVPAFTRAEAVQLQIAVSVMARARPASR
jgi:hypothetical protein